MRFDLVRRPALVTCALLLGTGCFHLTAGDKTREEFKPPRSLDPAAIAVPEGYRIEPIATGLTYPTSVTFDDQGTPYVIEAGYSYGEDFTEPRLLRINPDGSHTVVATGAHPPWTGVVFHQGAFYVAEGGTQGGGRIVRITPDGTLTPLVSGLPSLGDHHTNGPAIGPDGAVYFSVGTATNSGVVGPDSANAESINWMARAAEFHDIPCRDVILRGLNFSSPDPRTPDPDDQVTTGAFVPFGTETKPDQVIRGRVPCSGAVFRLPPGSSAPELVAWGFRNPYGLAFSPEGQLYVTENGHDERGSRPIFGAGDYLWAVEPGRWYGFPDFAGGRPVNQEWFKPSGKDHPPQFLLAEHPAPPPRPVAFFGVHSSSNGVDFSRGGAFGHRGLAFVAQFGDQAPDTGKVMSPVGYKVVRVDVTNGVIQDFAANKDKGSGGPASHLGTGGLERPIAVRFDPDNGALYVVDFGVMTVIGKDITPYKATGVLWRITPTGKKEGP
jgi:glucose/arabinose dehydrogenase